jgi:hypothetical protein
MYESSTIFIKLMFPNTFCPTKGKLEKNRGEESRIDQKRPEKTRKDQIR